MEIVKSFGYAIRGLRHVLAFERNARVHLLVAIGVISVGTILPLSPGELAAILVAVILVFLAEIINTAFEKTLDIISPEHHAQVRVVKDMAAGAVIVTAVGAVVIGAVIFWPYLAEAIWESQ